MKRRVRIPFPVCGCACVILLSALALTGCDGNLKKESPESEALPLGNTESSEPVGEETLTSILDRDGSDGYTGDLVLVYRTTQLDGGTMFLGNLDGLVETTENRAPVREETTLKTTANLYNEKDPYLTDEIRQADPCYDMEQGDLWEVGFQRLFYVAQFSTEMLFQVSAVGDRCRVWSPVNPDYGPLENIDSSYPDRLAQEMDRVIPILEKSFGKIPDIRGDGKMNMIGFDLNSPNVLGFTSYADIYEERMVNGKAQRGNNLPIVYVNTAPLLQGDFTELSQLYTVIVHEMTHSITFNPEGEDGSLSMSAPKIIFSEFLSVAAEETVYPGSSIAHFLPWWYSADTVWEDLQSDDADVYMRDKDSQRQGGKSVFHWGAVREDYAAVLLLAHFVENRGGTDAFARIKERADAKPDNEPKKIWEALWEELGYENYSAFMEEFLLSVLLHEEDGPYRLNPFAGYDPALCGGAEDPFSCLKPIITDKGIYIASGGYAVLRPVGGVYCPPVTASSDGLCYVGITLKAAEK